MSTTMPKAGQIDRKWYVIDAAGKPLGRVAAQAAVLLRGKHKPTFAPHVDCGDHVIIINCKDAVLTGGKADFQFFQSQGICQDGIDHPLILADRDDGGLLQLLSPG